MSKQNLILIVEDDRLDVKILLKGLKETSYDCETVITQNGKEALDYLGNSENPKPNLIFVDINMPIMNGVEFLREKRKLDVARKIPAVVFTTSSKDEDRDDCYEAGVAGYMIKPIDFNDFKELLSCVKCYWEKSQLPTFN